MPVVTHPHTLLSYTRNGVPSLILPLERPSELWHLIRARYYEPSTGRFISQDTYKGDPKVPSTLNLYAYCRNNPLKYTDPSGNKDLYVRIWSRNVIYESKGDTDVCTINVEKMYYSDTTQCAIPTVEIHNLSSGYLTAELSSRGRIYYRDESGEMTELDINKTDDKDNVRQNLKVICPKIGVGVLMGEIQISDKLKPGAKIMLAVSCNLKVYQGRSLFKKSLPLIYEEEVVFRLDVTVPDR